MEDPLEDHLQHIGIEKRSGRYPWGSGKDPYQRSSNFITYTAGLRKAGLSDLEIAKGLDISLNELRNTRTIAKYEKRAGDYARARKLKDHGYSNPEIGKRMGGLSESSVRSLLDEALQQRNEVLATTASVLKDCVERKTYVDIGEGSEQYLNISQTKLKASVAMLTDNGYKVWYVNERQVSNGKKTLMKVLARDDIDYAFLRKNTHLIKGIDERSDDGGLTYQRLEPIRSVSSKRVAIRYREQGGADKDGVIELRRNVEDLSLGEKRYGQVRIGLDDTHYLKGMAIYAYKPMPPGIDIIYNTNKKKGSGKDAVFKKLESDPDDPFGSSVVQKHYTDKNGKKQLSSLNFVGSHDKINEEGRWAEWKRSISSQFLSKQKPSLAKKQLGMAYDMKKEEFDEIMSLTNPVIKQKLLKEYADGCDLATTKLRAAAFPGQSSNVILPLTTIKENEIFAPGYKNGDVVVLIRHPHGGIFEIPELRVNNNNPEGKSTFHNAKDAVGINPKVAAKLSGADFDGDTVIVIPNRNKEIKTAPSLESLKKFEPKEAYPPYPGIPKMKDKTKAREMGDISNLITDMTIKGASLDEVARAVRHSMVVIDAQKHKLDYKRSGIEHNIAALKLRYQGGKGAGASTLISKASSEKRVDHRKDNYRVDPITGQKIFDTTGEVYPVKLEKTRRNGETYTVEKIVKRQTTTTKMEEEKDARKLSSGTPIEDVYAEHANKLKNLANTSRLESMRIKLNPSSQSAKETYAKEVSYLKNELALAFRNKPHERQAQSLANKIIEVKKKARPDMEKGDLKKLKGQALEEARFRMDAKKHKIVITDRAWEAIQAGAISNTLLKNILDNTDVTLLKQRAIPRNTTNISMSPARILRAKSMSNTGYTRAEIAEALGVSTTIVSEILK